MRSTYYVAALLAAALPLQAVSGQATMLVPTGGSTPAPVPVAPPADPDDTPESIAQDAARDLKDSRFYNRTRAQYDSDWQECRLIARGSRTPSGTVPIYYNPTIVSPVAAGAGGILGGLIAGAIAEGQQRRANRRSCLLIRGWRLVEVPRAEQQRVAAMTDAQRSDYFNTIVGAEQVTGEVTERRDFTVRDAALRLDAPVAVPGSVFAGRRVDPATPIVAGPNEGLVVLSYRRPNQWSAGKTGTVDIARYDMDAREIMYPPRNARRNGDTTTYHVSAQSSDRRAPLEVQVLRLTPGDYVISGNSVARAPVTTSYCFGAPTFRVAAGQVVYIGDFVPLVGARRDDGTAMMGMAHVFNIDDARATLATKQPALAQAMQPATLRNQATFACSAITMDRWDLHGVEALPAPTPAVATDQAAPAEVAPTTAS